MYCEIVYFIEENNCEKRHADLKPRGYNCFWIDPYTVQYMYVANVILQIINKYMLGLLP